MRGRTTLDSASVKRKSLDRYRKLIGHELIEESLGVARGLQGLRVPHLNSTASGGGVVEILNALVPLEIDSGARR